MARSSIFLQDPNPSGGKVCLLLHGLGTDSKSWVYQMKALSDRGYRPIAPDLPGFGKSKFYGRKWSVNGVTAELKDVISEKKIEKILLIGLSLGGVLALRFIIDYPEFVEKAILVNTFACLRPKKISEWIYLGKRILIANLKGAGAQAEIVAKHIFPKDDQVLLRKMVIEGVKSTDSFVYRAAMREIGLFDVRKRIKEIRTPVMVISGANDRTVGIEVQQDLVNGIKGSIHRIIPDAGHAVIIDKYELFNLLILDFIEGRIGPI